MQAVPGAQHEPANELFRVALAIASVFDSRHPAPCFSFQVELPAILYLAARKSRRHWQ